MSTVGTFLVYALNILSTPNPADQVFGRIPTAPAFSNATGKVRLFRPVLLMRFLHALVCSVRSFFILSKDVGVANSFQLSSGRPVGWHIDIITSLPFTFGSHSLKAFESARSGRIITSAVTVFLPIPGLQANCVPSSDFTRGDTISMCDIPRSQPRHSPHFSLWAGISQLLYFSTAQSLACFICGVPTKQGPISSKS